MLQCVANIRIFKYTQIFIDEYIHSPKYSWIFPEWIYSDILSRLFCPHEYIRIFIRIVRFQQIHSNKAAQQNISCYSKKLGNLTFQRLIFKKLPLSSSHFFHLLHQFLFIFNNIGKFFHMNLFVFSFGNILHGQIFSDIHLWKCRQLNKFGHLFLSNW